MRTGFIKLFNLEKELEKQNIDEPPYLLILTPTTSTDILTGFAAFPKEKEWGKGIYFAPDAFQTAIIAIDQLPPTPETLWLRLSGQGEVKQQALMELEALPSTSFPDKSKILSEDF